jgi:hypothetical protein
MGDSFSSPSAAVFDASRDCRGCDFPDLLLRCGASISANTLQRVSTEHKLKQQEASLVLRIDKNAHVWIKCR